MSDKPQVIEHYLKPHIEGVFRLRHPEWATTRNGSSYVKMTLEDLQGAMQAYLWQPGDIKLPYEMSCIYVRGKKRFRRDCLVADIDYLAPGIKNPEDIVRLIPRSLCPFPWLLSFVEALLGQISHPALKQFLCDVLSDDGIVFPFVSSPASLKYHHNYPGGLLRHSIECAQMVERYQEFEPDKKQLGMVAALFHDIGKILTFTPQMRLTSLGKTINHDKLTLEVLAPYLQSFDQAWPEGAAELRYLMTWRPGMRDSGIPKTPLANAVLAADRVSAGLGDQDSTRSMG